MRRSWRAQRQNWRRSLASNLTPTQLAVLRIFEKHPLSKKAAWWEHTSYFAEQRFMQAIDGSYIFKSPNFRTGCGQYRQGVRRFYWGLVPIWITIVSGGITFFSSNAIPARIFAWPSAITSLSPLPINNSRDDVGIPIPIPVGGYREMLAGGSPIVSPGAASDSNEERSGSLKRWSPVSLLIGGVLILRWALRK